MTSRIDLHLQSLGISLPVTAAPGGAYVSFVQTGNLVYIAGQVPRLEGKIVFAGKVGGELTEAEGKAAARLCGLNLIAQLKAACAGDLDRVIRCVRLNGAVNCTPEFTRLPDVINGASELMMEVFGERGKHTRVALGVASLPSGSATEIDGVFEIAG